MTQCGEPHPSLTGVSCDKDEPCYGDARLPDRFWSKIQVVDRNEWICWEWTGSKTKITKYGGGYGRFTWNRKVWLAHRLAYQTFVGKLIEGLVIDHLCRNHACVRPSHLEQVTSLVNIMRGVGFSASFALVTHCPQGHEYDEKNTRIRKTGARVCRACSNAKRIARTRKDRQRARAMR